MSNYDILPPNLSSCVDLYELHVYRFTMFYGNYITYFISLWVTEDVGFFFFFSRLIIFLRTSSRESLQDFTLEGQNPESL